MPCSPGPADMALPLSFLALPHQEARQDVSWRYVCSAMQKSERMRSLVLCRCLDWDTGLSAQGPATSQAPRFDDVNDDVYQDPDHHLEHRVKACEAAKQLGLHREKLMSVKLTGPPRGVSPQALKRALEAALPPIVLEKLPKELNKTDPSKAGSYLLTLADELSMASLVMNMHGQDLHWDEALGPGEKLKVKPNVINGLDVDGVPLKYLCVMDARASRWEVLVAWLCLTSSPFCHRWPVSEFGCRSVLWPGDPGVYLKGEQPWSLLEVDLRTEVAIGHGINSGHAPAGSATAMAPTPQHMGPGSSHDPAPVGVMQAGAPGAGAGTGGVTAGCVLAGPPAGFVAPAPLGHTAGLLRLQIQTASRRNDLEQEDDPEPDAEYEWFKQIAEPFYEWHQGARDTELEHESEVGPREYWVDPNAHRTGKRFRCIRNRERSAEAQRAALGMVIERASPSPLPPVPAPGPAPVPENAAAADDIEIPGDPDDFCLPDGTWPWRLDNGYWPPAYYDLWKGEQLRWRRTYERRYWAAEAMRSDRADAAIRAAHMARQC